MEVDGKNQILGGVGHSEFRASNEKIAGMANDIVQMDGMSQLEKNLRKAISAMQDQQREDDVREVAKSSLIDSILDKYQPSTGNVTLCPGCLEETSNVLLVCQSCRGELISVGKNELIIPTNAKSSGDKSQRMEDIQIAKKIIHEAQIETAGMGGEEEKELDSIKRGMNMERSARQLQEMQIAASSSSDINQPDEGVKAKMDDEEYEAYINSVKEDTAIVMGENGTVHDWLAPFPVNTIPEDPTRS